MDTEKLENGTLHHWTPQEVHSAMEAGEVVLIDVRTPQEYALERIKGALLSPMQELDAMHLPEPTRAKPVVLHCGSGVRSRKMAELMLEAGWSEAAHLAGGMGAWKKAKLAYVGLDVSTGAPTDKTDE